MAKSNKRTSETIIRFLPVMIPSGDLKKMHEEVAGIDVDEFRQQLVVDSTKEEIKILVEKRRVLAMKLSNGSESKEVDCYWEFFPDVKFVEGDMKPTLGELDEGGLAEEWESSGKGYKILRRNDDYENAVEVKPMDEEDFQEVLPFVLPFKEESK